MSITTDFNNVSITTDYWVYIPLNMYETMSNSWASPLKCALFGVILAGVC